MRNLPVGNSRRPLPVSVRASQTGRRSGRRLLPLAALATLVLGGSLSVRGMEVNLQLAQEAIWEDQSAVLEVRIVNPEGRLSRPRLPATPGLVFRGPVGPISQEFINQGRRTSMRSYRYDVSPAGGRTGTFRIGPATVDRGGGTPLESDTVVLRVYKKPPEGISLGCEVTPEGGPVGYPFRVVYTVYYSGQPDEGNDDIFSIARGRSTPFGLSSLNLPLLTLDGVKISPLRVLPRREATEVKLRTGHAIYLQQGFHEAPDGSGYKTLVFGFEVVPMKTGSITIPPAAASMSFRTGRTRRVRDGLFLRDVAELVQHDAKSEAVTYTVRELPRKGRPPGFTGAIGQFTIDVSADPTSVSTMEPITLEIRVSGRGLFEEVRQPDWSEIEALTRDFVVHSDVDSGTMEGNSKVFRQIIRPRNEKVMRIPPIPFPYFDPRQGKYLVATAPAIPITVEAVRTVGAEDSIPSARSVLREETGGPSESRGVPRNLEQSGIGANFTRMGAARPALDPRDHVLAAPFLAVVFGPPFLFLALVVLRLLARRNPQSRARLHALSRARTRILASGLDFDGLCEAYQDYFRERLSLPAGELTPADLARTLSHVGALPTVQSKAERLLEEMLAGRFGGAPQVPESLRSETLQTLREVDRCSQR